VSYSQFKEPFMEVYNKISIAKDFSFTEGEGNLIKESINSETSVIELGNRFAVKENTFILNSLINSEFIVEDKLKLKELQDFVLKNDPHNIHILFVTHSVKAILIKNKLILFDQELKEYTFFGRKVFAVECLLLENKIMLVCNEINHLEGTKIKLFMDDKLLKAERKLKVLFSKQKIWLCEVMKYVG